MINLILVIILIASILFNIFLLILIIGLVGIVKGCRDILINQYGWDVSEKEKEELFNNFIGTELRKVLHVEK